MGKNRKPRNAKLPVSNGTDLETVAVAPSVQDIPENSQQSTGVAIGGAVEKPAGSDGLPIDGPVLSITGEQPQQDPVPDPQSGDQSPASGEGPKEPEALAEQSEPTIAVIDDGYVPLMTLENIAQAADEAAQAVAIQAGETGGFNSDSLDHALLCVDFVRQWPEAPVSAMVIHVCRAKKFPTVELDDLPPAARVSIRTLRLVALECLAAEKEHRSKFDADLRDRERRLTEKAAYDRADLAMTPEDDNPLSELGRAAARG